MKGKAKELFEEWYCSLNRNIEVTPEFYNKIVLERYYKLTPSEKWGVLQDFFDSKGIYITESASKRGVGERNKDSGWKYSKSEYTGLFVYHINGSVSKEMTRQEARQAALNKAEEILSEKL